MARPAVYQSDAEKPVSVSVRIPRDLYEQAQQYVSLRRTTLTGLLIDGLRLRLGTPADQRELLVSVDNITVMQELQEMVEAAVEAALTKRQQEHGKIAPGKKQNTSDKSSKVFEIQPPARDGDRPTGKHDGYGIFLQRVRAFVEVYEAPTPFTYWEAARALGATPVATDRALQQLVKQGKVRQEESDMDVMYYRVSTPAPVVS